MGDAIDEMTRHFSRSLVPSTATSFAASTDSRDVHSLPLPAVTGLAALGGSEGLVKRIG